MTRDASRLRQRLSGRCSVAIHLGLSACPDLSREWLQDNVFMPEPTYQELVDLVASQAELIEKLTARVAELERRLGADSSNSSRPPSSDSVYTKKVAKTRSARQRSGRKPGKKPGDPGVSRSLTDHPDKTIRIDPDTCTCLLYTSPSPRD